MSLQDLTFRKLDPGWKPADDPPAALESWYESVRDVPLSRLEIGHICRAIRQRLFLEHILPIALVRLDDNPLAGELYEGELAVAVASVPSHHLAGIAHLLHGETLRSISQSGDPTVQSAARRIRDAGR